MILRIIDMGYPDPFGHELMYTNSVYDAAEEKGFSAIIYGSEIPIENIGRKIVPLFKDWKQIRKNKNFPFCFIFFKIYEMYYVFKKLKSLYAEDISPDDIFLFHSPVYRHFPSILFWYRKVKHKPRLILILRYSNLPFKTKFKWIKKEFYLKRIKQWILSFFYNNLSRYKLILGTDSDILAEEFQQIWKMPVVSFPIPIPNQIYSLKLLNSKLNRSCIKNSSKKESLTLISLGPARDDKGSYLLYEAIIGVLDLWKGINLQFIIQTKTSEKGSKKTKKTIKLLSSIDPCVKTYNRELSQEEYWNIFYQADIVLLPYDADEYRARTSGIFAEAMALGKHAVIPRGTWMEKEIIGQKHKISLFDGRTSFSLIDAILKSLEFESHLDQDFPPDKHWKEKHNSKSFIEVVYNASKTR